MINFKDLMRGCDYRFPYSDPSEMRQNIQITSYWKSSTLQATNFTLSKDYVGVFGKYVCEDMSIQDVTKWQI